MGTPKVDVGKSNVTPCKHYLLDKLLGMILGVSSKAFSDRRLQLYDLTAGDGVPFNPDGDAEFARHCSPGIHLRHLTRAVTEKPDLSISLSLVERQAKTFAVLQSNVAEYLSAADWEGNDVFWGAGQIDVWLKNRDCRELAIGSRFGRNVVNIYNDPNNIESWALTPEMLRTAPELTTSLSTLGCNVAGLKRLPYESRQRWYDQVSLVTNSLVQPWHDACLMAVNNSSQWAYLLTVPKVWQAKVNDICVKATRLHLKRTPTLVWWKDDPDGFLALQHELFLRKSERNA